MKDNQIILILILFVAFLALLTTFTIKTPLVFANTTNQTNVTVEISSYTQITVIPRNLTWFAVSPGTQTIWKHLQVRNSGTLNISRVYVYADTIATELYNPIISGIARNYSSGGVLVVKQNDTPYNPATFYTPYYVDRLEWNISIVKINAIGPTGATTTGGDIPIAWGYYRNTSGYNYLFYLVNGSELNDTLVSACNTTNSKIMIEADTDIGEPQTRNPAIGGTVTATANDWGIYTFASGPLNGHCVAIYKNCEKILVYRYDRRTGPLTNFNACDLTNDQQSVRTTQLTPNDEFQLDFGIWPPDGIPAGSMEPSWVTLEAGAA